MENDFKISLHIPVTRSCWVLGIAQVRYMKILKWLRGFPVIFLYLVWFSLCSSLFWELRGNGVVKNLQFCPLSLGVVLESYLLKTELFSNAILELWLA